MSSSVKLLNSEGTTLTVSNSDLLLQDKDVIYLDTVEQLTNASGSNGDVAHLSDLDRGGVFVYDNTSTDNQGTVFGSWERQYEGAVNVKWFGAKGDGTTDDTVVIQNALSVTGNIFLPEGTYLINPSISVILNSSNYILGEGRKKSILLAKYNVAGAVIKRDFNPLGINDYVSECIVEKIGIYLNHVNQTDVPSNIQIGIDFSNITRSCIIDCYVGNNKSGLAGTLYPNGSKQQMARGYGIVMGNVSGSDQAYAGGEVNKVINSTIISAKIGIGLDLIALTGGVSAAYACTLEGNDIQSCQKGISQESQYGAGNNIKDNVIQDAITPSGESKDNYHIFVNGYNMNIGGGYFESVASALTNDIKLGSNSDRIVVNQIQHSHDLGLFFSDEGANNVLNGFIDESGTFSPVKLIDNKEVDYVKGYISFDASGNVLKSLNAVVNKNATGDYNVLWQNGVADDNSVISVNQESSASRELRISVTTHSSTTTRVETYSLSSSPLVSTKSDPVSCYVQVI